MLHFLTFCAENAAEAVSGLVGGEARQSRTPPETTLDSCRPVLGSMSTKLSRAVAVPHLFMLTFGTSVKSSTLLGLAVQRRKQKPSNKVFHNVREVQHVY